jgi:hypothetical protein
MKDMAYRAFILDSLVEDSYAHIASLTEHDISAWCERIEIEKLGWQHPHKSRFRQGE